METRSQLPGENNTAFTEKIEPVERDRANAGEIGLSFDYRREMDIEGQRSKGRHQALIDAAVGADFEIGTAGKGLHGGAETAGGGVAGEVDGHDHGDTQGNGQGGEDGA